MNFTLQLNYNNISSDLSHIVKCLDAKHGERLRSTVTENYEILNGGEMER